MRATLTFDLPDDEHDLRDAMAGTEARFCLQELSELLRSRVKYGSPTVVQTPEAAYEEIRSEFLQLLDAHYINLDD
jgi:predicted DNA-binding transcriptional regulator YafY